MAISGYTFRPAGNSDASQIQVLVGGALAEFGMSLDIEGVDADIQDIEASYFDQGGELEVVEDDHGRIVATLGWIPKAGTECELRKMYLAPSVRGKGLGKEILSRTLARLRRKGYRSVTLETASSMTTAVGFYERIGFRPSNDAIATERCDTRLSLDISGNA